MTEPLSNVAYNFNSRPYGSVRLLCTGPNPGSCGADNSAFIYVPFGNNSGLPDNFEFMVDDGPGGGHNNAPPSYVRGVRPLSYTREAVVGVNDATNLPYVLPPSSPYRTDEDTTMVVRIDRSGTTATLATVEGDFRVYVSQAGGLAPVHLSAAPEPFIPRPNYSHNTTRTVLKLSRKWTSVPQNRTQTVLKPSRKVDSSHKKC